MRVCTSFIWKRVNSARNQKVEIFVPKKFVKLNGHLQCITRMSTKFPEFLLFTFYPVLRQFYFSGKTVMSDYGIDLHSNSIRIPMNSIHCSPMNLSQHIEVHIQPKKEQRFINLRSFFLALLKRTTFFNDLVLCVDIRGAELLYSKRDQK